MVLLIEYNSSPKISLELFSSTEEISSQKICTEEFNGPSSIAQQRRANDLSLNRRDGEKWLRGGGGLL